jgi:hypothetical protein
VEASVVLGSVNVLFGVFVGVQAGYLFGGARSCTRTPTRRAASSAGTGRGA